MRNSPIIIKIVLLSIVLALAGLSCKKKPGQPVLTTEVVTDISQTSAVSGGNVTYDGGSVIVERGVCWNSTGDPTIKVFRTSEPGSTGSFKSVVTGLTPWTLYYLRAYATNETGTGYGDQVSFTTLSVFPVSLITRAISSITATGAVSGGEIISDGGGPVTSKGVCWAEAENPTTGNFKTSDGTGPAIYNSYLTSLDPGVTYYVRAYAINFSGTSYGDQLSFTTPAAQGNPVVFNPGLTYGSVSDIDGNKYKTIQIGNQLWMAENLRSTKYNDGSPVTNIIDDESWNAFAAGAYCWSNNDIANKSIYGALYNWYAVSTGKLCPSGWHVPSHTEWTDMISLTGDMSEAGGRMKETGTLHWLDPNTGATNESGFTAVPGGIRTVSGYFQGACTTGRWWKSTEGDVIELSYDTEEVKTDVGCVYRRGLSVRCVRDL